MGISISPQIAIGLLIVFLVYIFFINRNNIRSRSSSRNKILYSLVILIEVLLIVGSRLLTPRILRSVIGDSSLYDITDLVVFFIVFYVVFKAGQKVKKSIS